jgi:glycosyltransferase involved in cell wall biosynthesis
MNMHVSIIIPARNSEQTLAATLDSLIAQTDPAWEALVVDDGSTDRTADIIGTYSNRDPRFKVLVGPATGVSAARNVGLAQASGRRVLFLDSDDWIDARFLEQMNAALDSAPDAAAAIVAGYCPTENTLRSVAIGNLRRIHSKPLPDAVPPRFIQS